MWLFDPSSPCIAILTRTPRNHRLSTALGNLFPVTRNLSHDGLRLVFPLQPRKSSPRTPQEKTMLWTITIVLFILWLLGLVSGYTLGGWIHILIVLTVIVLVFNLIAGRRAL
jgi:hypothetical protein